MATSCRQPLQCLGWLALGQLVGHVPHLLLSLEGDRLADVRNADLSRFTRQRQLRQLIIQPAQIRPDAIGQQLGGIHCHRDLVNLFSPLNDPRRQLIFLGRLALLDRADFLNQLVNFLIGRQRVDAHHQSCAVGGLLKIILKLLTEFGDEGIGISHDDDLPSAEHREAAQLIEDIRQLGALAIDINPRHIGRHLRENLAELLKLEE